MGICSVGDDKGRTRDGQEEAEQQRPQSCPSQLDGFSTKTVAQSGERTCAMEDERIIWRVPHVAEDGAERGPARVEDLGIQLHERLWRSTGR